MKEIERKYIFRSCPKGLSDGVEISQGYLSPETRVRKKGQQFFLTEKIGSGLVREETELEVNKVMFDILWKCTEGKRVEKTRYKVDRFEVDVFENIDLIMVEIELENEFEIIEFPPTLLGIQMKEVTQDERFTNARLALDGFPILFKWEEDVKKESWSHDSIFHQLYLVEDGNRYTINETLYDRGLDPGPIHGGYRQCFTTSRDEAVKHYSNVLLGLRKKQLPSEIIGWTISCIWKDDDSDSAANSSRYGFFTIHSDGSVQLVCSVGRYKGTFREAYEITDKEREIRSKYQHFKKESLNTDIEDELKKYRHQD